MNAKHSAILLSGLLLMMIGIAWAQGPGTAPPTCPAVSEEYLQEMLVPSAWVKANWNMNASIWEIDCTQMDAVANMAPGGPSSNATSNQPSLLDIPANIPARANRPARKRRP